MDVVGVRYRTSARAVLGAALVLPILLAAACQGQPVVPTTEAVPTPVSTATLESPTAVQPILTPTAVALATVTPSTVPSPIFTPSAVPPPTAAPLAGAPGATDPQSQTYEGIGVVTKLDPSYPSIELKHEAIPGQMPAMQMEYYVTDVALLKGLVVGDRVTFTVRVTGSSEVVSGVRKRR